MIMNCIIIEKELLISHLALIVTKNNSFLCVFGEDIKSCLTCIFVFVSQFAEATFSFVSVVFVFLMHILPSWYLAKLCHLATAVFVFANVCNTKAISRSYIYFRSTIAKYIHKEIFGLRF